MEPSEQENLSVQNENQSIHSHQENLEQSQKQEEQENKDLYESGAYEDRITTENLQKGKSNGCLGFYKKHSRKHI